MCNCLCVIDRYTSRNPFKELLGTEMMATLPRIWRSSFLAATLETSAQRVCKMVSGASETLAQSGSRLLYRCINRDLRSNKRTDPWLGWSLNKSARRSTHSARGTYEIRFTEQLCWSAQNLYNALTRRSHNLDRKTEKRLGRRVDFRYARNIIQTSTSKYRYRYKYR